MYLLLYLALAVSAPPQAGGLERLTIDTATGTRTFMVEVVREESDRNRGLMFRRSLAADRGMLFDYDPPQQIAFWMKNTYIPLDIIFVGADGKIITIAAKTTPLSLEQIPSGGAARGVLEIAGGVSATLGIKVGDRVRHRLFDSAN
ncbi:MAG: DUF192 domain-containing protein [Alphaproteobacteria bacterium]|nr:DUF192 domain-containing protein [Alphaproteobacteria bacterium]